MGTPGSYLTELISVIRQENSETVNDLLDNTRPWEGRYGGVSGYNLLLNAIECKRSKIAKLLIKKGVDINSKDENPMNTPLHFAVLNRDVEIVKILIDRGAHVNAKNADGFTPLHCAAKAGILDIALQLLRHGADVHAKSKNNVIPLECAIEGGSLDIVRLLLKHGTSMKFIYSHSSILLHTAIAEGHTRIVKWLLTVGASINAQNRNGDSALHIAIEREYTEIVLLLLEQGASVHSVSTSYKGYTPLHMACQNSLIQIVKVLLRKGADVNAVAQNKITPIYLAVKLLDHKMVELLLRNKANVDTEYEDGKTILYLAVEIGNTEMINKILSYFPDINKDINKKSLRMVVCRHRECSRHIIESNFGPEGANDSVLVHAAIENGYFTVVEKLLKYIVKVDDRPDLLRAAVKSRSKEMIDLILKHGVDVNAVDELGCSALHYTVLFKEAADHKGYNDVNVCTATDVIKFLIMKGADIDVKTKGTGSTTLHLAVMPGCEDIVQVLLEHDADVNLTNKNGVTALYIAAEKGMGKICRLLAKRGADVNTKDVDGLTVLCMAIQRRKEEIVHILLEHGVDVNLKNENGTTPLYIAVEQGMDKICRLLIKRGADVNAKNKNGLTALHVAASIGNIHIVEALLDSNISLNSIDENGDTPLHLASQGRWDPVILTLLQNGSDVNIVNKKNLTAVDILSRSYTSLSPYCPNRFVYIINYCFKCIVQELSKMQIAGLVMNKESLKNFTDAHTADVELSKFKKKYKEEIERMKNTEINNSTVTFYDILTKGVYQVALYARNENVVQALKLNNYSREFPEYAPVIRRRFIEAMIRKELLDEGCKFFRNGFSTPYDLPDNCIGKILSYFDNMDLTNLKHACFGKRCNETENTVTPTTYCSHTAQVAVSSISH